MKSKDGGHEMSQRMIPEIPADIPDVYHQAKSEYNRLYTFMAQSAICTLVGDSFPQGNRQQRGDPSERKERKRQALTQSEGGPQVPGASEAGAEPSEEHGCHRGRSGPRTDRRKWRHPEDGGEKSRDSAHQDVLSSIPDVECTSGRFAQSRHLGVPLGNLKCKI